MAFLIKFLNSLSDYFFLKNVNILNLPPKTKLFWFASLAVVVMGKEHTISKANRQLGNTTSFKRLDQDPSCDLQRPLKENLTEKLDTKQSVKILKTLNISQSQIPEQADSISSPKFTNLATLDAQLSLQTLTQPNGSQSLLTYTTCL